MVDKFQVYESNKSGLNSKESYIVTRDRILYLRILGCEPQYSLVTATASEDGGHFHVCNEKIALIAAAKKLGNVLETKPSVEKDWLGREYVTICGIKADPDRDMKEFRKELSNLLGRFFDMYDCCHDLQAKAENEMIEIYDSIAIDDMGGDVYLSDGVWLSSDGSFHDRGR